MKFTQHLTRRSRTALLTASIAALALLAPAGAANAYAPAGGTVYQLDNSQCLKGRGNCAIYPKSAELPSGRLVAAFEKSTVVPATGGAAGQMMPVYKSDDDGDTWQPLSTVGAPAALSSDPRFARYTSNWTNPYFYVLPQDVGDLRAGTLLLATVVSGEDEYFLERKAADPNWVPSNDGDRRDVAIALFASNDEGTSWRVLNIIADGGWQGGSAGNIGGAFASGNTTRQIDPVWEPHLLVRDGKLVAYYSDENDYLGFDTQTGIARIDPDNATAPDSQGQILAHRTWDGRASTSSWSATTVDVAGSTVDRGNGKTQIGGGRPGMTTIAPTTDGKWFLTYEYFGGGDHVKYKVADDPLRFFAVGGSAGDDISRQRITPGSRTLDRGGSPVLVPLPDGRILYNAASSGSIWVNESGRSDGTWTEFQTPLGAGYSRNLQYVRDTGRVVILQASWGGPGTQATVRHAEVDLGRSAGPYYQFVNRRTGQVLGTNNRTNDANLGNNDTPDIRLEQRNSAQNPATQFWHLQSKADGRVVLLNKAGGREAAIWTGNATAGQALGQWVDNAAGGRWNATQSSDGWYTFQSAANNSLYLTGATVNGAATLQTAQSDGSQQWQLVQEAPSVGVATTLRNPVSGRCLDVHNAANGTQAQIWDCVGNTNQRFTTTAAGELKLGDNCLSAEQDGSTNGTKVILWQCLGKSSQQWDFRLDGSIVNRASGLLLDVAQRGTSNGALLQLWTANGGPNQNWERR